MRSFLIGFLSLALWGCSDSKVSVTTHKPPAGWRGVYILAPEEIESRQGLAYSQVLFLGGGQAQVMGYDKALPDWGFTVVADSAPAKDNGFQLKCRAIFLYRTEGKAKIIYHQVQGEAGKYMEVDKATEEAARKIMAGSARIDSVIPKALRHCEDTAVSFHPQVKPGGEVVLATDGLSFQTHDSEEFRAVVKKLPVLAGELKAWTGIPQGFSRAGEGMYEAPSNEYLPMPQTKKFYGPRMWSAQTRAEGGLLLKGSVPARPNVKAAKSGFETNEFLYNLIERGEWVEPRLVDAHLYSTANGAERELGKPSVSADGLEISAAELGEGMRMEIDYSIPGDDAHVLVQTLTLSADGKLTASKVELVLK